MKYIEKIGELFKESCSEDECPPDNKLQFIGNEVFDFTTYDSGMDEYLAKKMLEVLDCILNKSTFEYQEKSNENYINYITMVNMPFLNDKLEWGTSIRGAWLDEYGHHSEPKPRTYKIGRTCIEVPKIEIKEFVSDLINWSNF